MGAHPEAVEAREALAVGLGGEEPGALALRQLLRHALQEHLRSGCEQWWTGRESTHRRTTRLIHWSKEDKVIDSFRVDLQGMSIFITSLPIARHESAAMIVTSRSCAALKQNLTHKDEEGIVEYDIR